MSLNDFFDINLPYGIQRDASNRWFAFNREYKPLGWNTNKEVNYSEYPMFTKLDGLTEKFLEGLGHIRDDIKRDPKNGRIWRVMLYNDTTDPKLSAANWHNYMIRLKLLSKIKILKK